MKKPVLYIFNISHYCEKARWALDYFGIEHEVRHVMVGTHRRIAKKLGAKRGSVPFLHFGDLVATRSSHVGVVAHCAHDDQGNGSGDSARLAVARNSGRRAGMA